MKRLSLPAIVLGLFLFMGAQSAFACTTCICDDLCQEIGDCCPTCGGSPQLTPKVRVLELGDGKAMLTLTGLLTHAMSSDGFCGVGLQGVADVATVTSLELQQVVDGKVLYSFSPSSQTEVSLPKLSASGPLPGVEEGWAGFHASVPSSIPDGISTHFSIELDLQEGASFRDLAWALRKQGILAGGSAGADGDLDFHHYFIRGLSEMPFEVLTAEVPKEESAKE